MSKAYVKYLGRDLCNCFTALHSGYLRFAYENNIESIKDIWESGSVEKIRRTRAHDYNGRVMTLDEILSGDFKLAYEVKFEFENCLEKYRREMRL